MRSDRCPWSEVTVVPTASLRRRPASQPSVTPLRFDLFAGKPVPWLPIRTRWEDVTVPQRSVQIGTHDERKLLLSHVYIFGWPISKKQFLPGVTDSLAVFKERRERAFSALDSSVDLYHCVYRITLALSGTRKGTRVSVPNPPRPNQWSP